jgi:hypothetical protein
MSKKTKTGLIIGFIVVVIVAFYAGDKYAGGQNTTSLTQGGNGFAGSVAQRGYRNGGGFISGRIVAKDNTSITVQLNAPSGPNNNTATAINTGSKIIFYTDGTNIMKTTDGTADDLTVGKNIIVIGTVNSDGSVSAQSIQIRPSIQNSTQ